MRNTQYASTNRDSTSRAALAVVDAAIANAYAWQKRSEVAAVGGDSALNLEIGTLEDNTPVPVDRCIDGAWNIVVTEFAGGVVEARAWCGEAGVNAAATRVAEVALELKRYEFSVRRSKRLVRDRMLQLGADQMLTFTKRGKFESQDELWSAWHRFNRSVRKRYADTWRFVAVPELHADGVTWHMHVAVRGYWNYSWLRKHWYRALGGTGLEFGESTPGNVQGRPFTRRKGRNRSRDMAYYMAKYVGKGFESGQRSRRLFSASEGLLPSVVRRYTMRFVSGGQQAVVFGLLRYLQQIGVVAHSDASVYFWKRKRGGELSDSVAYLEGFIVTAAAAK